MTTLTTETGKALPVFDYEDFLNRIDGDEELLHEVIEIFLEDTPRLMRIFHAAVQTGDPVAVERAAHTLKGAAANISARRLHALCQRIQQAIKQNEPDFLSTVPRLLEENFDLLEQALRAAVKP